ncbi:MAG: riboflavin synthase [Candidatus Cloacimonetes bacterium]|nr:riboflavin synthase [Candidatus Cloacimonadota bacterium]
MFTGIVTELGKVTSWDQESQFMVACKMAASGLQLGESIAVNGVCLTVVRFDKNGFLVDVSSETRSRVALKNWESGSFVNLERALTLSDRLGGHLMQGHVDGVGEIVAVDRLKDFFRFVIRAPESLAPYMIEKGSIAVDGISLTLNAVRHSEFDLMIIPHTYENTCLKFRTVGSRVNLEADMIGKYVFHQLSALKGEKEGLSLKKLIQAGYGGVE